MTAVYHQPTRLEEALSLVAQGAVPVAGATGLYSAKTRPQGAMVDLAGLGLETIAVEAGRIALGATVTLSQIADSELPGMEGALLRRGARSVASRPMRNVVTVGGNLAHLAFWADMPVVLLALDAVVETRHAGQAAILKPLADCFKGGVPWEGGLITRVMVPLRQGAQGFGHERFSRTANDYSLATACATLRRDGAVARDVRLVIGALQPRPFRLPDVEKMAEGQALEAALLARIETAVRERVQVAPNFRASPEYRRELAGTLARRALLDAFSWAMREN